MKESIFRAKGQWAKRGMMDREDFGFTICEVKVWVVAV